MAELSKHVLIIPIIMKAAASHTALTDFLLLLLPLLLLPFCVAATWLS
jgi:hypothetical protein